MKGAFVAFSGLLLWGLQGFHKGSVGFCSNPVLSSCFWHSCVFPRTQAVTGQGPPSADTSIGSGFAAGPCLWVLLSSLLWKVL